MSGGLREPTAGESFIRPALVPLSGLATFLPTAIVLLLSLGSISLFARRVLWRRRDGLDERGTIWKLPLQMLFSFFPVLLLALILSPVVAFIVPPLGPNRTFPVVHPSFALVAPSQLLQAVAHLLLHLSLVRLVFPSTARAVGGSSRLHVPLVAIVSILAAVDLVWRSGFMLGQLRGDRGLREGSPGSGRTVVGVTFLAAMITRGFLFVLASGYIILDMRAADPVREGGDEAEDEREKAAYRVLEWGVLLANVCGTVIVVTSLAVPFFAETPVGHILLSLQSGLYLASIFQSIVMLPPRADLEVGSSPSDVHLARRVSISSIEKPPLPVTRVTPPTPPFALAPVSRPTSFVRHSRVPSPFLIASVDGIYIGRTGGLGRSAPFKKPPGGLSRLGATLGSALSLVRRRKRSSTLPMQDPTRDSYADLEPSQESTDEWEKRMDELSKSIATARTKASISSIAHKEPRPAPGAIVPRRSRRKTVPALSPDTDSTISSGIGMAMMGLGPPADRPPSLYTPDERPYMLAEPLYLANPDNHRSSGQTTDSRLAGLVSQEVRAPPPAALPAASSQAPPAPSTTGPSSFITFGSPIVSWGSAADAYTFILPGSTSVRSPLGQSSASAPLAGRRPIDSGTFPTTPEPGPSSFVPPATASSRFTRARTGELPTLPVLASVKQAASGGPVPVDPTWKTVVKPSRGGLLTRAGTASSRTTNGSEGGRSGSTAMGEEYEALEAYMEGRQWR